MKIVGMMLVRNEDWVLECSMRAALKWCDDLVLTVHKTTDNSWGDTFPGPQIINQLWDEFRYPSGQSKIHIDDVINDDQWNEMDVRQRLLEKSRFHGATHLAIIDADEVLTANLLPVIRTWFQHLSPGQLMDLPMVPIRGDLNHYQDDDSVWSRAYLTVGFRDMPGLSHRPGPDGYQHHNRPPFGCLPNRMRPLEGLAAHGGVMHLQFVNARRLLAKHVLYRMVDHLRWPGRETPKQLNYKYDQALQEPGKLSAVPAAWWDGHAKETIKLDGVPYQEDEIRRLLAEHGREAFEGLDLKGW